MFLAIESNIVPSRPYGMEAFGKYCCDVLHIGQVNRVNVLIEFILDA